MMVGKCVCDDNSSSVMLSQLLSDCLHGFLSGTAYLVLTTM